MALRVWLPLNGNLNNNGLTQLTSSGTPTFLNHGKLGKCISLTPRVTFSGLPKLEKFTITFWLRVDSCTVDWADDIAFKSVQKDGTAASPFRFEATTSSRACSFHNNGSYAITSGTRILITQKGEWHHCGFSYDGTNCYTYIDGVLTYTDTGLGGYLIDYFHIGETNAITGGMNDLRIYDECLSSKQIKEISKGLIVHYKLDNPYNEAHTNYNHIADCSGNGNNASIIGSGVKIIPQTSGRYENTTYFTTTNGEIKLPVINWSTFTNNYTFSWWGQIYAGGLTNNSRMPWGFSNGNRLNFYCSAGLFICNTGDSANNPYQDDNGVNIPYTIGNDGNWHHYTITGDGTNVKLYIDGVYKGKAKTYRGLDGTQIYISGWSTDTNYKWLGCISDFRIYGTVLTAEDIKQLYQCSSLIDNKNVYYTREFVENGRTLGCSSEIRGHGDWGDTFTRTIVDDPDSPTGKATKFECTAVSTNSNHGFYIGQNTAPWKDIYDQLKDGKQYIASWYVKSNRADGSKPVSLRIEPSVGVVGTSKNVGTSYTKMETIFTYSTTSRYKAVTNYTASNVGDIMWFHSFQVTEYKPNSQNINKKGQTKTPNVIELDGKVQIFRNNIKADYFIEI